MKKEKIAKSTAHYRPKATSRHCQDCTMFRSPSSCTLVEGSISRFGTCDHFDRKKNDGK